MRFGFQSPKLVRGDRALSLGRTLNRIEGWPLPVLLDVDPRELRLLPSQAAGADPYKLQMPIARFGASMSGMPPPWVYRGSDHALVLYNGITRATRIAKLAPGALIRVEVVGSFQRPVGHYPKIGDTLP